MFNSNLLTVRNIIAIGVLSILSHVIASPLYKIVSNKDTEENG